MNFKIEMAGGTNTLRTLGRQNIKHYIVGLIGSVLNVIIMMKIQEQFGSMFLQSTNIRHIKTEQYKEVMLDPKNIGVDQKLVAALFV